MTDPIAAAVEPIREKFVQAYVQWLPEMLKLFPHGVSEHPFAIQHDKALLRNLYRIDFATRLQPKPEFREFRLSDMLAFRSSISTLSVGTPSSCNCRARPGTWPR